MKTYNEIVLIDKQVQTTFENDYITLTINHSANQIDASWEINKDYAASIYCMHHGELEYGTTSHTTDRNSLDLYFALVSLSDQTQMTEMYVHISDNFNININTYII